MCGSCGKPLIFFHREHHHHDAPVLFDQHPDLRAQCRSSAPKAFFASRADISFHGQTSWRYIAVLRAEWLLSPTCFDCGGAGRGSRTRHDGNKEAFKEKLTRVARHKLGHRANEKPEWGTRAPDLWIAIQIVLLS